jgi:hypothetical protein
MRTTIDLDDELFERALRRFPAGTSKRVVLQEALRALIASPPAARSPVVFGSFDHVPVRVHADFDDPVPGFDEDA